MSVFFHELKQNRVALAVWTLAIAFLLMICVLIYPEMSDEMGDVSDMFSSMGSFTQAFGMDKINFGEFMGFYGIECGNILGLGGAFFASLISISMLAKEEKDRTAEFLFTHPVSRVHIIAEKLCAVIVQILVLNAIVFLCSVASITFIGEAPEWKELVLLHVAYLLMQLEIAFVCFGISSFIKRGGFGIGLGFAAVMYFLNIIANIADRAEVLKYITPFGYTESADIITDGCLDGQLVLLGALYSVISIIIAFVKYNKKDLS